MIKHGWICLIVGGLLAASVGTDAFSGPRALAIAISLVVALGPLLILVGYDKIADRSGGGPARSGLQVAGVGLLILTGTWCAAVVLPLAHDSRAGEHVASGETVAYALIALGSLAAGTALLRRWVWIALPLLIGTAALIVTLIPAAHGIPAFTVWAVSCVVLGLALKLSR